MIAEERRAILIQELNDSGYVQVAELAEKFEITSATIRRDLSALEKEGLCLRKRGGAVRSSTGVTFEPSYDVKRLRYTDEKRWIANEAAKLVEDGSTLILDAGSTMFALALKLLSKQRITVVTNDLHIAVTLAANPNIHLICTGGVARANVFSLQGSQTETIIKTLRVDKTFIGADAIHEDATISNVNIDEVPIKQAMIAAANQVILLADSSKFEKTGFVKVCDLAQVDLIITDRCLSKEKTEMIRSLQIPLIIV
jgi:DeoR/GlpR family transcriptional regulator of sugar metabolism